MTSGAGDGFIIEFAFVCVICADGVDVQTVREISAVYHRIVES